MYVPYRGGFSGGFGGAQTHPTNLRKKNEGRRGWRRKKRRRATPGLNPASATGSIAHVPFLYSVLKNHLKSNGFIFFIWIE